MKRMRKVMPLMLFSENRAHKVSVIQRMLALIFGAPNARRANAVIYPGLDIFGGIRRAIDKVRGRSEKLPIFEIDRLGTIYQERLPKIWLSEEAFNTRKDDGRRIFVECYPAGPDIGGERALELGDRYFGEGCLKKRLNLKEESLECFKAAEILYMHASRRGNRDAASRLREMYERDLCHGQWHECLLNIKAKHAIKRSPLRRKCA